MIHDRDAIFSKSVDSALSDFGVRSLRTPVRTPTANAFCERVIGTIRRECLDFIIPINERYLRSIVREFVSYYDRGRPHSSLGPGIPEPIQAPAPSTVHRHKLLVDHRITSKSILGGLHHDYLGKGGCLALDHIFAEHSLREAMQLTLLEAGIAMRPSEILVSEATTNNEVRYKLRAAFRWSHHSNPLEDRF